MSRNLHSRIRPHPLGLTAITCALVCGAVLGIRLYPWLRTARALSPAAAPAVEVQATEPAFLPPASAIGPGLPAHGAAVDQPQINVLVVVIDSTNSPAPALQAVWIAALHTELKQAYLLSLSPYLWMTRNGYRSARLTDAYAFDPVSGAAGPDFEAAVATLVYPPPAGTVTLDAPLLAELVDRLGGVQVDGSQLDGSEAMAFLPMGAYTPAILPGAAARDPLGELDRQAKFLNALRVAWASRPLGDPAPYLELLTTRGRSTLSQATLHALAAAFAGYNPADLRIAPLTGDWLSVFSGGDGRPALMFADRSVP